MKSITFTIFSEQQQVPLVRACIFGLCAEAGFDEKSRFEMELCVGEALNKIVEQSIQDGRCGEVFLTWTLEGESLSLEIRDRGTPITLAPNPNSGARNSPEANGSDGPLLYSLMDEVSYETDNGINRLRMSKEILKRQNPPDTACI